MKPFNFYILDPKGSVILRAKKKYNYYESFEVKTKDDYELEADEYEVKAKKCKSYSDINKQIKDGPIICQIPGFLPLFLIQTSLDDSKRLIIDTRAGEYLEPNGQNIVCYRDESLIVLPSCNSRSKGKHIIVYECSEDDIIEGEKGGELLVLPKATDYVLDATDSFRIVVSSDYFPKPIKPKIKTALEFKKFKVLSLNLEFSISKPVDISKLKKIDSCFENRVISVIKMKEELKTLPSYSFNEDYKGSDFISFPFYSFLIGLAKIPAENILGRLVHLCQSSGFGKTRLCFEALKTLKSGIYCVHRSDKSTGYPKSTPWMSELISDFKKSTSDDAAMLVCARFIYNAVKKFRSLGKDHLDQFEGIRPLDFEFKVTKKYGTLKAICKTIRDEFIANKTPFFLVMDECHEMLITPTGNDIRLSLYRIFRKVVQMLKVTPLVAIFLGTKSSLGDFVLNAERDSSGRVQVQDLDCVINVPTYIMTHSVDAMFTEPVLLSYEQTNTFVNAYGNSFICSDNLIDVAMSCGRPLWSQYESFRESFDVARDKLKCDLRIFELCCFILRTSSSVAPQDELAHSLVLSGMVTLLNVDIDGSKCFTEFIPEPMLSNAARIVLTNIENLAKATREYLRRLQIGTFHNLGDSGEFVSRLILLRAMDLSVLKIKKSDTTTEHTQNVIILQHQDIFGKDNVDLLTKNEFKSKLAKLYESRFPKHQQNPVSPISDSDTFFSPLVPVTTLREYLMMLTGLKSEELNQFGVSDNVLSGLVSLSQFVQTERPLYIDQAYLLHFFARSCGLILPINARGIDLIIPVLRTDNGMSIVAIQCKNLSDKPFPNDAKNVSDKMTCDYVEYLNFNKVADFETVQKDDFVRIVIQFGNNSGASTINSRWIPIKSLTQKALWLNGLNPFKGLFFNNKSIIEDLETILSNRRDFFEGLEFPIASIPTALQTTKKGAQFLAQFGQPLKTYSNIVANDAYLRAHYEIDKEFALISERDTGELNLQPDNVDNVEIYSSKRTKLDTSEKDILSTSGSENISFAGGVQNLNNCSKDVKIIPDHAIPVGIRNIRDSQAGHYMDQITDLTKEFEMPYFARFFRYASGLTTKRSVFDPKKPFRSVKPPIDVKDKNDYEKMTKICENHLKNVEKLNSNPFGAVEPVTITEPATITTRPLITKPQTRAKRNTLFTITSNE